jgi:alpha-L-arabinofuranosidase
VVNPSLDQPREPSINLRPGSASNAKATVLTASDPHAHSTLEQKDVVVPKDAPVKVSGGVVSFTFPPASVTKLEIAL